MRHYPKPTPLYVDPISKTPLFFLLRQEVADLNQKLQTGRLQNLAGAPISTLLTSGLYSPQMEVVYPVFPSDMACFLMHNAIPAASFKPRPEIMTLATKINDALAPVSPTATEAHLPADLPPEVESLHIEGAPTSLIAPLLKKGGRIWLTSSSPQKLQNWKKQIKAMENDLEAEAEVRTFLADPQHLPFAKGSLDAVWQHTVCEPSEIDDQPPISNLSKILKTNGWLWVTVARPTAVEGRSAWRNLTKALPAPIKQVASMLVGAGRVPMSMATQALQGQSVAISAKHLRNRLKSHIADSYTALFETSLKTSPQKTELQLSQDGLRLRKSAVFAGKKGPQQWFLLQKT